MTADSGTAQLTLGFTRSDRRDFDHFVPGPNAAVVEAVRDAACRASPVWPLIWGPEGCGKTHLLVAATAAGAHRRSIFLAADQLRRHGPEGLHAADGAGLVCLDDVDRLFGSREWEEALFHAVNRLRRDGSGVILSARTAPAAFGIGLPDLRSRLAWGSTHAMFPLDDASRRAVVEARARLQDLPLGDDVIEYLYRRSPRDTRSLVELVDRLAALSLAEKRRVTVPLVRQILTGKQGGTA